MPYQAHTLFAVSGKLGSVETWTCTFRTSNAVGVGGSADDGDCDDVLADWRKFRTAMHGTGGGGVVTVDEVTAYEYAAGAQFATGRTAIARSTVPYEPVSSSGMQMPPQTALVFTLDTGGGVSPKSGRFFWPWQPGGAGLNVAGYISSANATLFAQRGAELITDLNNWPGIDSLLNPGVVKVFSEGNQRVPTPHSAVVTGVRVGNVVDTMRSRRRQLPEFYSSSVAV